MADWYTSSAAHALVPVFAISTGYTVGQFVRRITTTPKAQWVMRCTVAGTSAASEPTWPTANNGTVVSGGATFANVTGQSTYGWSAPAGDLPTLLGAVGTVRFVAGDRMFVSSDHTETQTAVTSYGSGGAGSASYSVGQVLSVNRAGSVPPMTPTAARTVAPAEIVHVYAAPTTANFASQVQSTFASVPLPVATTAPVASATDTVHGSAELSRAVKRTGPPIAPETIGA